MKEKGGVPGDEFIPDSVVLKMFRAIERYSVAAVQDEDPAVAFLHANYAAGASDLLGEIVPHDQIKRVLGLEYLSGIRKPTIRNQDQAQANLKAAFGR